MTTSKNKQQPRVVLAAAGTRNGENRSNGQNRPLVIFSSVLLFLFALIVSIMIIFQNEISDYFFNPSSTSRSVILEEDSLNQANQMAEESPNLNEIIEKYIIAQNDRDISLIKNLWSLSAKRYYGVLNPTKSEIQTKFNRTWKRLRHFRNVVTRFRNTDIQLVEAEIRFEYIDKTGVGKTVNVVVEYEFDENGKLISEYQKWVELGSSYPDLTELGSNSITHVVNAEGVSLRYQPSLDEFVGGTGVLVKNVLAVVNKGTEVTIISGTINSDKTHALLIASQTVLHDTEVEVLGPGKIVNVIRKNELGYICTVVFDNGDVSNPFQVNENEIEMAGQYDWLKIRANEKEGYVLEKYLD